MPRPGSNNATVLVGQVTRKVSRVGLPDYYVAQPIVEQLSAHRHPATSIGVVRPDGTRPMLPWQHAFIRIGCPPVTASREIAGWLKAEGPWNPFPVYRSPGKHDVPFREFDAMLDSLISGLPGRAWYIEQVAKTRLLDKLSQQKMQLGVTALEAKQTAGLLTDLATDIVKGLDKAFDLRDIRGSRQRNAMERVRKATSNALRGGRRGAKGLNSRSQNRMAELDKASKLDLRAETDMLNRAKDRWMQYSFGLKPLIYDSINAGDALCEHVYGDKASFLVSAKAGYSYETVDTQYIGTLAPGDNCDVTLQKKLGVHFSVVYEMPIGGVDPRNLLGLDNPGATLWEWTKLSWLFDYAIGFGDWLNSMTASNGLIFREGCKSTIMRSTLVGYELQDRTGYIGPMPGGYIDAGKFDREVLTVGVTPGVVPQIKRKLGLIQLGQALFALSNWGSGKPSLR